MCESLPAQPLRPVLVVDDLEDDVFFTRRALSQAGVRNPVVSFPNVASAQEYLAGTVTEQGRRPCAVLCDIKMPVNSGFELLAWLKEHEHFRDLPVVMLTNSGMAHDRETAEQLGADGYLVKYPAPIELASSIGHLRGGVVSG